MTKSKSGFEFDKDFKPAEPTLILTATSGPVTVVTKLYGIVGVGRYEREKKEVEYRAHQLAPIEKRERRERVFRQREETGDVGFSKPRMGRKKLARREHAAA